MAYATSHFAEIISSVINNVEPISVCTDDGKEVVIISHEAFESMRERLYLLSSPANADRLRRSLAMAEEGKSVVRELVE